MKKMKVKALIAALMAGVMTVGMMGMTGCGGGSSDSESGSSDDKTITIWATGSDNVRQI